MNACSQLVMKRFNLLYSSCPPFENPFLINGFLKGGSRPFLPLRIKKDDCVFVLFFFFWGWVGGWVGGWVLELKPTHLHKKTQQRNKNKIARKQQRPNKYGPTSTVCLSSPIEEPRLLQESPEDEGFLAILQARRPQACGACREGMVGWMSLLRKNIWDVKKLYDIFIIYRYTFIKKNRCVNYKERYFEGSWSSHLDYIWRSELPLPGSNRHHQVKRESPPGCRWCDVISSP